MTKNIFDQVPQNLQEELFEQLASGSQFRIERIISTGQASPQGFWYDQPENEWVLLLQGSATIELAEQGSGLNKPSATQKVNLLPGDYLLIPSHQRHRVATTNAQQTTIWLAIHFLA